MAALLGKNLSLCFSIIKRQPFLRPPSQGNRHPPLRHHLRSIGFRHPPSHGRFFFSSPGRSNSIVDSDDPYTDFRRSMGEMVEARGLRVDTTESWKSLQELLLCYLSLNPKHMHRFIVAAFSHLLLSLLHPSPGILASTRLSLQ